MQMWCIYTMEYHSTVKKNEVKNFESKRMETEKFLLNEVTQTQKDKHHILFLIEDF